MAERAAIAIAAHPDDIEFTMAGTLLRLREAGWQIHCLNVSSGDCGSLVHSPAALRRIRAVTAEQVRDLAAELFARPRSLTVVGPFDADPVDTLP